MISVNRITSMCRKYNHRRKGILKNSFMVRPSESAMVDDTDRTLDIEGLLKLRLNEGYFFLDKEKDGW